MAIHEPPKRHSDPSQREAGFTTDSFGMRTAPVAHVVRAKTRALQAETPEVWKDYNSLARIIRIVNRGMKGPLKGKGFCGKCNSEMWPEGADPQDEETWLQPGEYMDVPKDVALYFVGNLWDPKLPDRIDIIQRYGGPQYERPTNDKVDMRNAPMNAVGPAPLPDLLVCEVGRSDMPASDYRAVFDLYQPEWAKAEKELVTV